MHVVGTGHHWLPSQTSACRAVATREPATNVVTLRFAKVTHNKRA
jgi:hypothetical protein